MVAPRPFFIGKPGCVRSSACIWLFSSTLNTSACSGGFKYSPTMASSFSANCGSLLTLKLSTRCGFKPLARQMRDTDALEMPISRAIVRVDHCVALRECSGWSFRSEQALRNRRSAARPRRILQQAFNAKLNKPAPPSAAMRGAHSALLQSAYSGTLRKPTARCGCAKQHAPGVERPRDCCSRLRRTSSLRTRDAHTHIEVSSS